MTPQIYLLHFTHPYRHAQHYLGFTEDLDRRLQQHRSGRGSPLVAAAINAGIDFELAATWTGDRREEPRNQYRTTGSAPLGALSRWSDVSYQDAGGVASATARATTAGFWGLGLIETECEAL